MGIFSGLKVAEQAMSVHRYRSEVAAGNLANVFTPGYEHKRVVLGAGSFSAQLDSAGGRLPRLSSSGLRDAGGAVRVLRVRGEVSQPGDHRAQALQGTVEMMESKNAYELSMRSATVLKSMALGALEIGRGG